jgi:hypothetical protein
MNLVARFVPEMSALHGSGPAAAAYYVDSAVFWIRKEPEVISLSRLQVCRTFGSRT